MPWSKTIADFKWETAEHEARCGALLHRSHTQGAAVRGLEIRQVVVEGALTQAFLLWETVEQPHHLLSTCACPESGVSLISHRLPSLTLASPPALRWANPTRVLMDF